MMTSNESNETTNTSDIYFSCRQCEQSLVIAAEAAGMVIDCPHCSSAVTVPSGDAEADAAPRCLFEPPLSADAAAAVERSLVSIMGPIGRSLAEHAIAQATTAEELQEMLLACIPSANDQDAFLEACRRASESAAPRNTAAESVPQVEKPASSWDEATIENVTRNLAVFIGPIASVMVRRALAKARTSAELCGQLAVAIPDEKDRKKFLESSPAWMR